MVSPALELVKMVTTVLALDAELADCVQALRRNLLAQVSTSLRPGAAPPPAAPLLPAALGAAWHPPRAERAHLHRLPFRPLPRRAQLHIRDFSPEAQFREPCRTSRLADVACASCHQVADLDLSRDSQVRRALLEPAAARALRPRRAQTTAERGLAPAPAPLLTRLRPCPPALPPAAGL